MQNHARCGWSLVNVSGVLRVAERHQVQPIPRSTLLGNIARLVAHAVAGTDNLCRSPRQKRRGRDYTEKPSLLLLVIVAEGGVAPNLKRKVSSGAKYIALAGDPRQHILTTPSFAIWHAK